MESWQWYPFQTYVLLQKVANVNQLETKFQADSKPFLKGEGPSNVQRAKEVSVRKTISADRKQLVLPFIGETVFLALISTIMAVAVTFILLRSLNQFTEKHIDFSFLTDPATAFLVMSVAVLVGILAGFYPALVLSSFKPINVLKGNTVVDTASGRTPWLRHGLVVIQFSLSVLLIISAIV